MANKFIEFTYGELLIGDFLGTISFPGDVTVGGDLTVTGSANIGVDETITGELYLADGTAAAPAYSFASDTDTGFYRAGDDNMKISIGNNIRWSWIGDIYCGETSGSGSILNEVASAINPTLVPSKGDYDTGVGWNAANELSLIAGGTEGLRIDYNELEVQPKMTLAVGPIELEEDSGAITMINLPVSSTPSDGDEESYTFAIDSNAVLKVKASANGTGGVDELQEVHYGGHVRNTTTVNVATYDLLAGDDILLVTYTATAAMTSLTLPTAQTIDGRVIVIKDAGGNANTNNITIDTEAAQTIDGAATLVINTDYDSVTLVCDGTNWLII